MEVLPCSRVAHIERKKKPYNSNIGFYTKRNALRVAEVWMDDYKSHVYIAWNLPLEVRTGDFPYQPRTISLALWQATDPLHKPMVLPLPRRPDARVLDPLSTRANTIVRHQSTYRDPQVLLVAVLIQIFLHQRCLSILSIRCVQKVSAQVWATWPSSALTVCPPMEPQLLVTSPH